MNLKIELCSAIACLNISIAENDRKEKESLGYKIKKFNDDRLMYGTAHFIESDSQMSMYIRAMIEKNLGDNHE